jgi:lysozyme
MPPYGVDVSSNNHHPINWGALASYLRGLGGGAQPFAIVKISQGIGYVNPYASEDIAAARAAGFAVGGYLMDQGNAAPVSEEAVFQAHSEGVPQFDDDELPEGLTTKAYIAHLDGLVAQDPAALNYLNQSEENEGFPAGGGTWEANYNNQPGVVHRSGVLIHQYTSSATVPGCSGLFDLNVWLGTATAFNALFRLTPPPVAVATTATQPPKPIPGSAFMNVEFSTTTGSDGTAYVQITIPPGCTHILGGWVDVMDPSGFDPTPHHDGDITAEFVSGVVCAPAVGAKDLPAGVQTLRITAAIPNHFYTGRAVCG